MGQIEGFRQYVCAGCGGVVIGIAVLRQLSGEVGQHIWTAEPPASAPSRPITCPFCSTAMAPKAVPSGNAATCRACEVVWLDKQVASSLPVRATETAGQPTLEAQSQAARCEQCGAPVLHSWDERCQYCGAALHAPTKVVVLPGAVADDQATASWEGGGGGSGHHGLLKEVMTLLARPIDD
jgi:DNA-directed RNA polymerase subunit M/transcription elongation factor TFIIS